MHQIANKKTAYIAKDKISTNGKVAILVQGGLHIGNINTFLQKVNVLQGVGYSKVLCTFSL